MCDMYMIYNCIYIVMLATTNSTYTDTGKLNKRDS